MTQGLKVLVVGVGNMGRHHARVFEELPRVQSVAVVDPDEKARERIEERGFKKVEVFDSLNKALAKQKPDCATIAAPTKTHYAIAEELLNKKIPVLVEKPLTDSVKDGAKLIALAKKQGTLLMVGHLERFNPAVQVLKQHIEMLGKTVFASTHRYGIPTAAELGDAFYDQAVHDVDVLSFLTGERPKRVSAVERQILDKRSNDLCAALFEYDGFVASVEANRVAPIKTRELFLVGLEGTAFMDYNSQELVISKLSQIPKKFAEYKTFNELVARAGKGNELRLFIKKDEPLKLELMHFLDCVLGEDEPKVTGLDGLYAVAAAEAAIKAAETGKKEKVVL